MRNLIYIRCVDCRKVFLVYGPGDEQYDLDPNFELVVVLADKIKESPYGRCNHCYIDRFQNYELSMTKKS